MHHYCEVCDKTIEIESESKHLQSLTHNIFEGCIQTKRTIESPDLFDITALFNQYITNHNKKF